MSDKGNAITQTLTWLTVGFSAITLQQWIAIAGLIVSYLSYRSFRHIRLRQVQLLEQREQRELEQLKLAQQRLEWEKMLAEREHQKQENGNGNAL